MNKVSTKEWTEGHTPTKYHKEEKARQTGRQAPCSSLQSTASTRFNFLLLIPVKVFLVHYQIDMSIANYTHLLPYYAHPRETQNYKLKNG